MPFSSSISAAANRMATIAAASESMRTIRLLRGQIEV